MDSKRTNMMQKTLHVKLAMEASSVLDKIRDDFPDNPGSMDYFYDLYQKTYAKEKPAEKEGKTIGTMCVQVPDELIYAAGAKPLRLCNGSYSYDQVGADFMPTKSCALVKATMGMMHLQKDRMDLDMVIIPTTCDQKKKSGIMLEEMGFNTYMLEMPSRKDTDNARHYWQNSIKELALELQKTTGTKITKKRLKSAIDLVNRARFEYRRLDKLRRQAPSLLYGKDAFLVTNAYFFDEIEPWTAAVKRLNDELEERSKNGKYSGNLHSPRLLFTGSPPIFPNMKVPLLVEELGGIVALDEVCSSSRMLYDLPSFDEGNLYDMFPGIADRYLKPCTCPCFVNNDDRKRKLLEMTNSSAIDGVVYQAFSGCQLYEMEHKSISQFLSEKGIPMLYLESDYSPEDKGQITTRIEAFIESIRIKKKKGV